MDVLTLVAAIADEPDPKDDRHYVMVDPAVMYPGMVHHIEAYVEAANAGKRPPMPEELVKLDGWTVDQFGNDVEIDPLARAREHLKRARFQVPAEGWQLALVPYEDVKGDFAHQARDKALECARLWFTSALNLAMDKRFKIKILRNYDYRLHNPETSAFNVVVVNFYDDSKRAEK